MSTGDFSAIPDDFSYVFHAAVDTGADDWRRCVETNAQNSGDLLYHCRTAKGFVFCSTGSIYGYQGQRPLTEADPPGVPLRAELQLLQDRRRVRVHVGRQAVRHPAHDHPDLLDLRAGGWRTGRPAGDDVGAASRFASIRMQPNNYNPIYEDDYVELGIRAMEVAATPPIVVNWAGSETVSVEDYCTFMGELVGVEPIFEYTPERTRRCGPTSPTCIRCSDRRRCPGARAFAGWSQRATRKSPSPTSTRQQEAQR